MKIVLGAYWDFDGTLGDTEPLHQQKLIAISRQNGVVLREEDFSKCHTFLTPDGKGGHRESNMILHGAGDEMIYHWLVSQKKGLQARYPLGQWLEDVMAYYVDNADQIKPRESIPEIVEHLHYDVGAIQGIVTVGMPRQVQANLKAVQKIRNCFEFVITGQDVARKKPHPEAYDKAHDLALRIAAKKGPETFVFGTGIEDSPIGTQAVVAAGLGCVHYVLPGQKPYRPASAHADRFRTAHTSSQVCNAVLEMYQLDH